MDVLGRDAAIDLLQKSNLIIVSLEEIKKKKAVNLMALAGLGGGVNPRDLAIFARQLSTLFDSRVPVIRALKTLMAEAQSKTFHDVLTEVLDDVSGGSVLSIALSKHPRFFSYFFVSMVAAGEESGKLQEVFAYLADYLERNYDITSKVRNALIYPAFILFVFVLVIVLMLVIVVPKMVNIFIEAGQQVPLYTQIIFNIASILRKFGLIILVLVIAALLYLFRYIKTPGGKERFDAVKLQVPVFGGLFRKFYLSRFADNLANLISAGVPVIKSLQITASVIDNKVYETVVLDAAKAVKAGNTIGYALEQYEEMPPLFTQMVRIGEEAGKLDFILDSLSRFYKRDVDNLVANIVSLIEPVLIIVLGAGVGLLVAAILIPLYNMTAAFS